MIPPSYISSRPSHEKKSEKCAAMRLTDKIMTSTCTAISDRTHDQENVEIEKFKLTISLN